MWQGQNSKSPVRIAGLFCAALLAVAAGIWHGQEQAFAAPSAEPQARVAGANEPSVKAESPLAAGKYLVKIGGCNDCHSAAGMQGREPTEAEQLTGSPVGFRGPWGTTYASNLRVFVKDLKEDDFVVMVRARNSRPPMPWASLHAMSDPDLRALFRYIKSLPQAGQPTSEYVSPAEEPKTPYVSFVPVMPKK